MGVDLQLIRPVTQLDGFLERLIKEAKAKIYLDDTCFDFINFKRDYEIFGQIKGSGLEKEAKKAGYDVVVYPKKLPKGIKIKLFDGEEHRLTRANPYGDELEYVYAYELKKIRTPENTDPINKAVMAYVTMLPKNEFIILEWN